MRAVVLLMAAAVAFAQSTAGAVGAAPRTLRPRAASLQVYVSASEGDDRWQGTLPHPNAGRTNGPVATLPRARDLVRMRPGGRASGATVLLAGGVYALNETLTLTAQDGSAAATDPVVYRAMTPSASEPVVVSGGVTLTGCVRAAGPPGLVRCPVPPVAGLDYFESLFVNGARRTRARTPNADAPFPYFIWARAMCEDPRNKCPQAARFGFVWSGDDVPRAIFGANGTYTPAHLGRVQAVIYHGWTASRQHVRAVTRANSTVTFLNPADRPIGFWPNKDSEGGGRYWIDNTFAGLDAPGEWWFDEDKREVLYLTLPGEEPGSNLTVVAPRLTSLLNVSGADNVAFSGLQLAHTDWECGNTTKDVCDMQSAAWETRGGAVTAVNATNLWLRNLTVHMVGATALWFADGCTGGGVAQSTLQDLGSGGVRIGNNLRVPTGAGGAVDSVAVIDTRLLHGGLVTPSGTPLLVQMARNVSLLHNEVADFAYTGINLGWSWNFSPQPLSGGHRVVGNLIHDIGRHQLGDAMSCIYTLGVQGGSAFGRSVVTDNVCHDVQAFYGGGYCLSQDQGSSNITFARNVCLRTAASPQNTHYGTDLVYDNNIFAQGFYNSWTPTPPAGGLRTSPQGDLPNNITFTRNLVVLDNASALLFEGDFNDTRGGPEGLWHYTFERNLYWSPSVSGWPAGRRVFGGCTERTCRQRAFQYTWAEWRAQGRDARGLATDPLFADPAWRQSLNVTLRADSPALSQLGFQQIDTSQAGPRPAGRGGGSGSGGRRGSDRKA